MKKILCLTLLTILLVYLAPTQMFVGYEMQPEAATSISVPPPLPPEDYTRREPLPDSDNIRIGVTSASFDDVGQILRYFGTGVDFFPLFPSDLNNIGRLSQFYAIFINCGSHDSINPRVLNSYVYQGGIVYASDHAGRPLQEAFPDIFSYTSNTRSQTVRRAEIVHSTLAAHMGMTTLDVIFNLGGWYAVTELDERATVYIQGDAAETGLIPLAFSFNYGSGTVFYTSFHNSVQATMDMIDFIEYLVFRIKHIEIDREMAERAERDGLYYRGQIFGRVQPGAASAQFAYTFEGDEFMLMLDEAQGNFSIDLTDPFGNVFRTNRQGEITSFAPAPGQPAAAPPAMALEALDGGGLRVIGGAAGEWNFSVVADEDEAEEAAFALGIATAPRVTITRAAFVQALAELDGVDLSAYNTTPPTYQDVPRTAPYFAAVEWATGLGIVGGVGEGQFAPSGFLTHEQMLTMLQRYNTAAGITLPSSTPQNVPAQEGISPWALDAVTALHASGFSFDGGFGPRVHVNATDLESALNFIAQFLN